MKATCSASQVTPKDWAISLDFEQIAVDGHDEATPVAIHFVVDNSASMSSATGQVRDIFSEMVDSVATAPCSMTVFSEHAEILSSDITTGEEMRNLRLPTQGLTNIPAGIQKAIEVILGHEKKTIRSWRSLVGKARSNVGRTHHVLVLLSDGAHNRGPHPTEVFPTLRERLPDDTKLSVIVVGYTANSSTSMAMLLKKSVETVAFDSNAVETIYFATSRPELRNALTSIETSLNKALKGTFHEIKADSLSLVEHFGSEASASVQVHLESGKTSISLLYNGDDPPQSLVLDGQTLPVQVADEPGVQQLSQIIQGLIDRTKIQVVASQNDRDMISKSVACLDALIQVLELKTVSKSDLQLQSVSPKERVKLCRDVRATCHGARALRNQVLDIANFSNQSSEGQANFLNGRSKKFANKALRRAAKTADGILVDPKTERKAILKGLLDPGFTETLKSALAMDVVTNLFRLSEERVKNVLIPQVREANHSHALMVVEIRDKMCHASNLESITSVDALGLSSNAKAMVLDGTLAEYLNDICHGGRQSYLSLSSPWQHLQEWMEFGDQPDFESTWEMLMYGGFVGYPLMLEERSSGCQMNPYLLQVKGVRHSLADTASICCANQAEMPVYGPEGGAPIKDILVLIDPAMPRASKMICNGTLLGEKFTSATIARDLQMYTGINMRIALHSNTLFHLLAKSPDEVVQEDDVIANLRRTFLGRAFMCPQCGFGPVDHFACSDLMHHHGEQVGQGVSVSNACPRCTWFSSDLSDWNQWDGTVCQEFLDENLDKQRAKAECAETMMMSEADIDMVLRILYSLRKMCESAATIQSQYSAVAEQMATQEQADLSTKAGIDGMSQILLALMNPFVDRGGYAAQVFQPQSDGGSAALLLSIIHEECSREARQRFRTKSAGDKQKARELAIKHLEKLLKVDARTAPETLPQMESEPPAENVRMDCDDSFQLDAIMVEDEIGWVRGVARRWCRAWSFAKGLCKILEARGGVGDDGWSQLFDRDMETESYCYQDVIKELKEVKSESPRDVFGMEEVVDIRALYERILVSAISTGGAEIIQPNATRPARLLNDPEAIFHETARELRMQIYVDRVRDKMAVWKVDGEQQTFWVARAADIGQYCDLVQARSHVHAFDKPTFWGLWNAARNTRNQDKMAAFLSTANDCFSFKYAS